MIKKISIFFASIIFLFIISIIYFNKIGIETNKFNNLIKKQIKSYNKDFDISLIKVKLLLDLKNFSIKIKTINPNIIYKNKSIELESISTNFLINSYFKKNFLIKNLSIISKNNDLKELIEINRYINNTPNLVIISQFIKKGKIQANINITFDEKGRVKSNYRIDGKLTKGELNILNKHYFKNIVFNFEVKNNNYKFDNIDLDYNNFNLKSDNISIKKNNNNYYIDGNFRNDKSNLDLKTYSFISKNNLKALKNKSIIIKSTNKFNLILSNKFKIKDFFLESNINIDDLKYQLNSDLIKKYLVDYKDHINFKNISLKIKFSKKNLNISGNSKYFLNKLEDEIIFNVKNKKDLFFFDLSTSLDNNELNIQELNYNKKKKNKAIIKISGKYKKNKSLTISKLSYLENKNKINLENLKLNSENKILSFKKIDLNYLTIDDIKNNYSILRTFGNYLVIGKIFDGTRLIKDISDSNSKKNIFNYFDNINSLINIKIDKVYLDKKNFVKNLNAKIKLKKNKVIDLDLDSKFTMNEKFSITIRSANENVTVTTLYSDRAVPFVKNYKFIKGFENGTLDLETIKKNNISKSVLKIDNFKVKEVPVLAKLLTLASLQGIADLLTGEGIRFTDFEMIFSNKDGLMTIDEIYAIGPAISIMMNGYVQDKELISLRGTLVPATTINRSISSIPLLGDILIGKKVGEGVFGVSFKIKGPPKNLKTSVNPIKTLTPRFITRTLEKIKKKN